MATKHSEQLLEIFIEDLIFIVYNIQEFRKLFLKDTINETIIWESAPHFFSNYQRLFWNSILLSVGRFLDPLEQMGNTNISIDVLSQYADDNKLNCIDLVKSEILEIKKNSKKIKIWRNKMLAHRDATFALKDDYEEIKIHLKEIEDIVKSIGILINMMYGETKQTTISWDVTVFRSAETLLNFLEQGIIYSRLKSERGNWQLDEEEAANYGFPRP